MKEGRIDRPVLITGASGFVGHYVVRALVEAGYGSQQLVALVRDEGEAVAGVDQIAAVDITNEAQVGALIKRVKPRALIHLAAIAAPSEAEIDPELAWAVNVEGTRNLAEAMQSHASDGRFIFAGSSEAYGESFNQIEGPVSEAAPLQPMSIYAETKAAADTLLGEMRGDGLEIIRFRAFNHTGPGQSEVYVVPGFARQVARLEAGLQEPAISVGNLDAERDFLDVRQVAHVYAHALDIPFEGGVEHVYNLASGKTRSIQSILDWFADRARVEVDVIRDPARVKPNDVPKIAADTGRLQSLFTVMPEIAFEQTLADVLDDWREAVRLL
jgi:GDP-4-dehydro-6-deoxy-D-mannose reductase